MAPATAETFARSLVDALEELQGKTHGSRPDENSFADLIADLLHAELPHGEGLEHCES